MNLRSIKWQLQLWHGLVLVLVLAGFGFTAHRLDRESRFRRIDAELQQRATVVLGALRRGGIPSREDGAPGERPPRGPALSARDQALFTGAGANAWYFILWHREGRVLLRSDYVPGDVPRPVPSGAESYAQARGLVREFVSFTPPGECVIVGHDISGELAELRRFAWLLSAAGGVVLVLGLAGGWWLGGRAIRPIADISATAVKISSGDLSQRIPTAGAGSELHELAAVLNSTFARLEDAFAQQARFTSDAAHELRTPVAVLLTQTQTALKRERPAAEYRDTLEACQRAAQRMRRLAESLLALARLDAGQEVWRREPLALADVTWSCVELIRPLATEKGLSIHTELEPVEMLGDTDQIAQVITNLVTNAIHYNKPGGEIRLRTVRENDRTVLTVADTGPGIGTEDLPHIFERFYRADKSRARTEGGTGLGLAIVKSIVEAHAGAITVTSEAGGPTTFTVRWPARGEGEGSTEKIVKGM